jgi:hypothetical protein
MDYSLLVLKLEIERSDYKRFTDTKDFKFYHKHLFFSDRNENIAFIVVIIDYLQHYNIKKQIEAGVKMFQNNPSCVDPTRYAQRFMEYVEMITNYSYE